MARDGFFVVALAAWWRLRRSAYLLPHLRSGPASPVFDPRCGWFSRIRVMVGFAVFLTLYLRHWSGLRAFAVTAPGSGTAEPSTVKLTTVNSSTAQSTSAAGAEPSTCPFPPVRLSDQSYRPAMAVRVAPHSPGTPHEGGGQRAAVDAVASGQARRSVNRGGVA
jgi:hypothetical protein